MPLRAKLRLIGLGVVGELRRVRTNLIELNSSCLVLVAMDPTFDRILQPSCSVRRNRPIGSRPDD